MNLLVLFERFLKSLIMNLRIQNTELKMVELIWPTKIKIATINLSEIPYLVVPDVADHKLEFITQKFETTDRI